MLSSAIQISQIASIHRDISRSDRTRLRSQSRPSCPLGSFSSLAHQSWRWKISKSTQLGRRKMLLCRGVGPLCPRSLMGVAPTAPTPPGLRLQLPRASKMSEYSPALVSPHGFRVSIPPTVDFDPVFDALSSRPVLVFLLPLFSFSPLSVQDLSFPPPCSCLRPSLLPWKLFITIPCAKNSLPTVLPTTASSDTTNTAR
jgi:hypothetical protein